MGDGRLLVHGQARGAVDQRVRAGHERLERRRVAPPGRRAVDERGGAIAGRLAGSHPADTDAALTAAADAVWAHGEAGRRAPPGLTAEDLPTRLVRDIQVRTIRATARAVTYEEDDTPQDHDWDRAAVSAWLNELADNIERETDA